MGTITKTLILSSFLLAFPLQAEIPESFFRALGKIESDNNVLAIGDNKKAIGIYQIHYNYWLDATTFDKTIDGTYQDCFKKEYSKRVVSAYLKRYCPNGDVQQLARTHNGGPSWRKKYHLTNKYWEKFKKALDDNK